MEKKKLPFHRSTVRSISSKLWSYDGDVGSSFGSANFSKYLSITKYHDDKQKSRLNIQFLQQLPVILSYTYGCANASSAVIRFSESSSSIFSNRSIASEFAPRNTTLKSFFRVTGSELM